MIEMPVTTGDLKEDYAKRMGKIIEGLKNMNASLEVQSHLGISPNGEPRRLLFTSMIFQNIP